MTYFVIAILIWTAAAFFLGVDESIVGIDGWTILKTLARLHPLYWIMRLLLLTLIFVGDLISEINDFLRLW